MSILGTLFGNKSEPVSALQTKQLYEKMLAKIGDKDPRSANGWHDFLNVLLEIPEQNIGILNDLLSKISNPNAEISKEWTIALKRMLRKEKVWPVETPPTKPLWLEEPLYIRPTIDSVDLYLNQLQKNFVVEKTAQNIIEQLRKSGAFNEVRGEYKYLLVSPSEMGYRSEITAEQFIEFMIRSHSSQLNYIAGVMGVHLRMQIKTQYTGEEILLAMKPMAPTFKQERDIFRIARYDSKLMKKKGLKGTDLSLAAVRIERHFSPKAKYCFQYIETSTA